jgi:hypothetical protein
MIAPNTSMTIGEVNLLARGFSPILVDAILDLYNRKVSQLER